MLAHSLVRPTSYEIDPDLPPPCWHWTRLWGRMLMPPGHEHSLSEKGAAVVENVGISALRSTTEGIVPFRGWIRKLTGAERYFEKVASAIGAGVVRRAYLKGVGYSNHCQVPAAPRQPTPPADGKAAPKL